MLALVFSLHSVIAGFALGVGTVVDKTSIATLVAILSHKVIEAMSVGANFVKEKVELGQSIAVITLYCAMTPIGIALGMILTHILEGEKVLLTEAVALAIGSGSFIYLAFHEMSDQGAASAVTKGVLFSFGLSAMALLAAAV